MAPTTTNGRPTIGVLAGWQFYWNATPLSYLNPIYRGVRLAAAELGCNLLLGCGMGASAAIADLPRPAWPEPAPESESDFVPIGPWNSDGLIVVNPTLSQKRSDYVQKVMAAAHPVVFIGSGEPGPTILADNTGGILQAMRHLAEHGHQHIAFIAGSPEDMDGDSGDRLRAYQSALLAFNLVDDPRLVAFGRHTFRAGYSALKQIAGSGVHFSAVLASNDESALGAIKALEEAGHSVPDDMAVIGFDDRPESPVQKPALSSVHVPLFGMGYKAVALLLQRMDGQAGEAERIHVPTRLIARESCGCGRSAVLADVLDAAASEIGGREPDEPNSRLIQRMAASILAETEGLSEDEVSTLCQQLLGTFLDSVAQEDTTAFLRTLDRILRHAISGGDDAHLWQVAISVMRAELPGLLEPDASQAAQKLARELLSQARTTVSAAMRQQHRQHMVDQEWMSDRVSRLTAYLLNALDETQIYEILARHLPDLGIDMAWVALLQPEGDDPVAWSQLRSVTSPAQDEIRFASRNFPPQDWIADETPFSIALLPLASSRGPTGYVALGTSHLELNGAIAQQLTAALNTAQLYREATEGRRLAEEANLLKSRFLSTVSHELRTPLNLIVGLSGLLLQQSNKGAAPLAEPLQQDIQRIYANAQHLGGLIGDVLDLASSDAGQLRLTREPVNLSQALQGVAETGQKMATDKGLAWRAILPDSGPWVWGDPVRLRQVVLNLISNAIKFTDQGEVTLTVMAEGDSVSIVVGDTGLGILPDEQPAIFDEFRRSERSVTRGYRGLGLGLAICQRLVALHDGTISLHSTGREGEGSSFRVALPTMIAPVAPQPRRIEPALIEQRVLVLVPPNGSSYRLRKHLAQRGFETLVEQIDAAQTWISQLIAAPPIAVVLDISEVPDFGWDALKTIKSNPSTRDIPVLFYAAAQNSGALLEFDYLTKPIEMTELTRALDQHWLAPTADRPTRSFLVVDDDPDTLAMHARIVQAHSPGSRVLTARNGREALELVEQTPIDLVLLDLLMPGMDGFAVLEAMQERENTRNIPIIVITGQVLTETEMARLNQGVAKVLGKGIYGADETLAHLDAALERQPKLGSEARWLVRRAMVYIFNHYAEPVSREDLARHVGLSSDHLTYCFRQELGMPPITYLNRYRIALAKHLLKETDKSITEIALDVGFTDSGYFSRVFRRETSMSPSAYRRD